MCSLFFLFLSFIFKKVFSFSYFLSKNQGAQKKKKEIKKKKEMGSGVYVYGGKKRGVEKKEEKKFEREKTKLVLFVCSLCLVQSIEL